MNNHESIQLCYRPRTWFVHWETRETYLPWNFHNNTDHKPLKEGLSCTSAGLVYETTPCPPGDFSSTPIIEDAFSFITRLCCSMQHQHGSHDACLSLNSILLPTFMCSDTIVTELRWRVHDGTSRVILPLDKHFTVDVSGKPSKSQLTIKGPIIIYRLRGRRIISGITRFLGGKKGGISRNWEPQRGYHWKLWKDSEGGPLKFAWKLSHGGITKVIKSYKGGSLQWSKIQRGEKLNFTLFSPKSSALSPSPPPPHHAINNDRSLKARELARDPDVLISVSSRSPRLPPASTTFLS